MDGPTLKVEGFRELDEALRELPRATEKNVAKRALMAAGEPIAADFRSRVKVLTGRLERSIGVGTKLSPRQARLARSEASSGVEVHIGAAALPEATLEEFGSSHNAPRPALRPAWDAGWRTALEAIKRLLWIEIEKAAARAARKAARLIAKNGG